MRKAKLSLIATIAVGLLAISTAGVSTWAWFQTNASATVTTESTSTTITVSKPDDYTFCSFKGNEVDDYTPTNSFATDFRELTTTSDVNTYTNFVGIKPGKTMLFCVKIQNPNNVNLEVPHSFLA